MKKQSMKKQSAKVKPVKQRPRTDVVIDVGGRPIDTIEAEIRTEVAACERDLTAGLQHALAAGRLLIELKDRAGHGKFLPAVERCGLKPRTAQDYMRVAKHWPEIEKYATSAHLTLREAIVGLTRVGAGDILEDFFEEANFKMPEPEEAPPALPSSWVSVSLPPAAEVEVLPPPATTAVAMRHVKANAAQAILAERVKKVARALASAIEKYEAVALTVKDLTSKKQAVQVTSEFLDVDTAFATLSDTHRQVAAMITVLDGYARAQKAEELAWLHEGEVEPVVEEVA